MTATDRERAQGAERIARRVAGRLPVWSASMISLMMQPRSPPGPGTRRTDRPPPRRQPLTQPVRRRILDWLGIPAPFRTRHFESRRRFRRDYRLLARALESHLEFHSVLDVGCANGFLLEGLRRAGCRVEGVERSPEVREILPDDLQERVVIGDFTEAEGTWDLVTCVEVAEHIPAHRSEELVATLELSPG